MGEPVTSGCACTTAGRAGCAGRSCRRRRTRSTSGRPGRCGASATRSAHPLRQGPGKKSPASQSRRWLTPEQRGPSARREFERRKTAREERIRGKHLSTAPQARGPDPRDLRGPAVHHRMEHRGTGRGETGRWVEQPRRRHHPPPARPAAPQEQSEHRSPGRDTHRRLRNSSRSASPCLTASRADPVTEGQSATGQPTCLSARACLLGASWSRRSGRHRWWAGDRNVLHPRPTRISPDKFGSGRLLKDKRHQVVQREDGLL
jgi:hypothetical protein